MSRTLLPAFTLWQRELVRFLRQRNRVASAILQPALFWLLFGAGFQGAFAIGEGEAAQGFIEFLFPGTVVMVLLFTAIFATFSLIQDRNEGFLQSVLVAPVSRSGIVLGKVLGGATLALVQGWLFLLAAPLAGVPVTVTSLLVAGAVLALIAFALSALGFAVGWLTDSTQGFHAVMMLVLLPIWLLSGAFFPLEGAPAWLRWIMQANPLTYGVAAFRRALYGGEVPGHELPSMAVSLGVTAAFAVGLFVASLWVVGRRTRGDLK